MAFMESVVAALEFVVVVGGRACSSGGGKKECCDAEARNGRSIDRFPELDMADINARFVSSNWCASWLDTVPDGFLLLPLLSRSLSPSLSRSEPSPEAVPVVVSKSVPLVVLTSSRSLPSDISAIFDFGLASPLEDKSSLFSFSLSSC